MSGGDAGRRFLRFYALALLIVTAVMVARGMLDYSEVLPGLFRFLDERDLYPNLYSIGLFGLEDPRAFLIFLFAGAPTLAALWLAWRTGGSGGIRRLLGRLRPWRAGVSRARGLAIYCELAAIYLIGVVGYAWAGQRLGEPEAGGGDLGLLDQPTVWIVLWLAIGPFLDEGGTSEELGWRGYGLPLLLDRLRSPLGATLALGALWWLWHFPREIPILLTAEDLGRWAYYQGLFLVLCLALSVIISWYFFRTGGSALPALLIHGFTNVWSKAVGGPVNAALGTDVRTWVVIGAAVIVVTLTRGRLGGRDRMTAEVLET